MTDNEDQIREASELLGLDAGTLTPAGRLRCELVAALRCAVDGELSRAASARAPDLAKLITAVEALTGFLREGQPKDDDRLKRAARAKANLKRTIANWIAADEADRADRGLPASLDEEIALVRAENEALWQCLPPNADPAKVRAAIAAADALAAASEPPALIEKQEQSHAAKD